MKKIKSITTHLFLLTITFSLSLSSCKKNQSGPTGAKGEVGLQGPAGNANVKSFMFSTGCNWKADSINKSYVYRYHVADLTTSVIQSGAVLMYMSDDKGSNGNEWRAIPFTQKNCVFSFKIELSTVEVFINSMDQYMPQNPGATQFKVIVIPPAS